MSDISPAGTLFRHTLRVTLQGIFYPCADTARITGDHLCIVGTLTG